MPRFGTRSTENLEQAHPDLQKLFTEIVKFYDCKVTDGYRNEEEQNALYPKYTKVKFPDSKHNTLPTIALDVAPYPIDYGDTEKARKRFHVFAGVVMGVASQMGIKIRWGGDWDGDWDFTDQRFHDLPHFELL